MRWRVLGQVRAWDGERWRAVPARKERELLAILLLRPGQVADRGWLIDTLWPESPPDSAARLLNHYIWRLRRWAGLPDGALSTVPQGYLLDVPADDIDSGRFAALIGQSRPAEPGQAAELLARALELWHGAALADARTLPLLEAEAHRLDEQRLEAMELLARAQAAAGRHGEAAAVLETLTTAEPFREEPWRLLMVALHHSGRRPAALSAYQRLWRTWTDQLGIEPSQTLQDLHRRLLTGGASPPRQLPAAMPSFVGRESELAELDRLLNRSIESGTAMLAAITGAGGVGKTTLALRWAHSVADRFPDGQLHLDLKGFDHHGAPVSAPAAIRMLLNALSVAPQSIPSEVEAQAALLRSELARVRMLVILDNARDPEQIRPLLPGTAGCAVLVTSRDQLTGLGATHGATAIPIGTLSPAEARSLLTARLGPGRVGDEPDAVDEIIIRCGTLPLALAIVAARVAGHGGQTLSAIAADMRESSPLDALHTADPGTDLRSVFSWSYARVSAGAANLFRLLGLHPGGDFGLAAAASLAGEPVALTRRRLGELTQAHLLTAYPLNRFVFHDLLRQYAAELVAQLDGTGVRQAAVRRMLEFYLHTAHAADRLINRDRQPLALPAAPPGTVTDTGFQDEKQALVWFAAECGNLLALLEHCVHTGWDGGTVRLASAMAHYLYRSGQWIDQEAANRLAVAAADRDGVAATRAHARYHLARVCLQLGRHVEAESLLRQALRLCGEADDPALLGEVHHVLGWVLERQARHDEAFGEVDKALKLFEGNAHAIGQARSLNTLAWFHTLLGRHDDAIVFCESSLALFRDLDHREGRASALHTLGFALHHRGEHHRAAACYEAALELFRDLGLRYYQGSTLDSIADTRHALGDHAAAVTGWRESLTILEELRHPAADAVRAKLARPPARRPVRSG